MKKVLLIGIRGMDKLFLQKMREEYGDDVMLVTPEEAEEKGMDLSEFVNIPKYEIKAPPLVNEHYSVTDGRGKGQRARNRSKFKR